MYDLEIAKGDKGYDINFTVKTAAGAVYVLTGYTVNLKVWPPASPGDPIVDGACVIDEALNGTCHYVIASGDFDKIGIYSGELELTKAGVVESTATFTVIVRESA